MKKFRKILCVISLLILVLSNFACSSEHSSEHSSSSQKENCAITGNHTYRLIDLEYEQSTIERFR